jgi:serine/threonine protein kinase
MSVVGVESFVDYLERSQLLEPVQLAAVNACLRLQFPDSRQLARELLRREWLTAFQVNQLVLGRGSELILGPYVLLERLGEGGMGQVYKARHRPLGRLVALKVLRKEMAENPQAVQRFHREVQAIAQLSHPNIVRALDADDVRGTLYLAMELIEGADLCRMVRDRGPLPVVQACDYVRQAALGLQHAHEQGLVHRDIKPANLLVTKQRVGSSALLPRPASCLGRWGTVKILDLGLARLREEAEPGTLLTQVGSVMGTPDYIAPEQARNSHTIDIRADLYSLGCTFYFLLTGEVPFPEGSIADRMLQHQLDEPRPVEQVRRDKLIGPKGTAGRNAEVPAPVADLVRKMMAKCPELRPQTPAEVAAVLTDLLNKARPSNQVRRPAAPPCPPRPLAKIKAPAASAAAPKGACPSGAKPRPRPQQAVTQALKRSRKVLVYGGFLLLCILAARIMPSGNGRLTAAQPAATHSEQSPGPKNPRNPVGERPASAGW